MTPPFRLNDVIASTEVKQMLPGPSRVIGYDFRQELAWLIELPGAKKGYARRVVDYVKGPFSRRIDDLVSALAGHHIYVLQPKPDSTLQLSLSQVESLGHGLKRSRLLRDIEKRDWRHQIVSAVLSDVPGSTILLSPQEVLVNIKQLNLKVKEVAQRFGVSRTTVLSLLHTFWSGGSQRNALLPRYHRCGLPGEQKKSGKKLGRSPTRHAQGLATSRGYVLRQIDKDHLAWGYSLINKTRRVRDAYLLTSSKYWATHQTHPDGQVTAQLFPPSERPTLDQFVYWGKKFVKKKVAEILLPHNKLKQTMEARGGSIQDMVSMAGQIAAFDSTSCDVYLCSVSSRLKKLPAMTRTILIECQTELILGLYCGWEAASPATALKTLLHAASDKVAFCARFGIHIEPKDWPALLPKTILADNGELKGSTPTEAERQFGFGIQYTPIGMGDWKGNVESEHHAEHKLYDHKLPGTTLGKKPERGEESAVVDAIWNYFEYMEGLIKLIIRRNTEEEVPHLVPLDMSIEWPNVKPTRLNIFRWLESKNMVTGIPVDVDVFRAFTLPDYAAVLYKNGVYLMGQAFGRTTRLPRLRYSGPDLVGTGLMSKVKREGKVLEVVVKLDAEDLTRAWLKTEEGLVQMELQVKDSTFRKKMTLTDLVQAAEHAALRGEEKRAEEQQRDMDDLLWKEAVTKRAKMELKDEIKALGGAPSKQSFRRGLRGNVEQEKSLLEALNRQLELAEDELPVVAQLDAEFSAPLAPRSGMGSLMDSLNAEEDLL